jgi:citrate synthase
MKRELPLGFARDMILTAPSKNVMNKLARSVLALYSYDENPDDISVENVLRQSINLIGYFPSLIAYGYQAKRSYYDNQSLHIHYPDPELSTAENILRLIRPTGEYTDLEAKLLDLSMILHAEHGGGNNSSFTLMGIVHRDGYLFGHCCGSRLPERAEARRRQCRGPGNDGGYQGKR